MKQLIKYNFGELFINSIDKDGTGTGLDYDLLELIPKEFNKPVILSGQVTINIFTLLYMKKM